MAIKDLLEISSRAVVCQDVELKGQVSIGPGTVLHPKCTLFAVAGPIIIGSNNIFEENSIVVNRRREPLVIGDDNLFSVGSRVECSVGSYNTFLPKSNVGSHVRVSNCCTVGAGVGLLPKADADVALEEGGTNPSPVRPSTAEEAVEVLEPYTVLYLFGDGTSADRIVKRRVWDGSGEEAERDLRRKLGEYLKDTLPKVTRIRVVDKP